MIMRMKSLYLYERTVIFQVSSTLMRLPSAKVIRAGMTVRILLRMTIKDVALKLRQR